MNAKHEPIPNNYAIWGESNCSVCLLNPEVWQLRATEQIFPLRVHEKLKAIVRLK